MNINLESTTVSRCYTVSGAPTVTRIYVGGDLIPDTVTVIFVNGACRRIEVAGPRAKKDGSPSQNRTNTWFDSADELPPWLEPFTAVDYTPGG